MSKQDTRLRHSSGEPAERALRDTYTLKMRRVVHDKK